MRSKLYFTHNIKTIGVFSALTVSQAYSGGFDEMCEGVIADASEDECPCVCACVPLQL